jgi:hypothetical protein
MVHKPKHKVHSFRGLLGDNAQDEINLERSNLNLAYRIIKFQVLPESAADENAEATIQIWKEKQTMPGATTFVEVNFTNPDLLATALWVNSGSQTEPRAFHVVFDNVLFSRNLYVSNNDPQGRSMNYYIELEEVPVNAATLMQLKLGVARKLNLKQ